MEKRSPPRREGGGVEDGPEVDGPAEQDKPENGRQTKLEDGHAEPALEQLPQARDEETAEAAMTFPDEP